MKIKVLINNKKYTLDVQPNDLLIDVLREIGYVSVKRGCDTTNCGLCTVYVDEKAVLSCSILAITTDGKEIYTLEGLKEEAQLFTQFLTSEGGEQCGFCSPGFIMNVLALKREIENPNDQEIEAYLAGNLCRCTGFQSQLRAIKKYLEV